MYIVVLCLKENNIWKEKKGKERKGNKEESSISKDTIIEILI